VRGEKEERGETIRERKRKRGKEKGKLK